VIIVSRGVQTPYQRAFKAICREFNIGPEHEYGRLQADIAASLYAAYLEARADLTMLTEARNGPGRSDHKNREIRAQRRQMLVAMKAYANQMHRLTSDCRPDSKAPPLSADKLVAMMATSRDQR
jgi:hypothetical protein